MSKVLYVTAIVVAVMIGWCAGPGVANKDIINSKGGYNIDCNAVTVSRIPCPAGCSDFYLNGWIGYYATINYWIDYSFIQCPRSHGCTMEYWGSGKNYNCNPVHAPG
jgi:hypothetical protein